MRQSQAMRGTDLDACLASALRGEPGRWPEAMSDPATIARAAARVEFHGVASRLVNQSRNLSDWPQDVVAAIRAEARIQALWEAVHRKSVAAVIGRLAQADIPALVLKGTALAHSVYDDPSERHRGDTDLLVRRADMGGARAALKQLGWRPAERQVFQETWALPAGGFDHQIDLHWRLRNMLHEPEELGFEACLARSVPLARLHPSARTTDPATTLLNCAINHAAHRVYGYGGTGPDETVHLGGICDTDRLVRNWGEDDWTAALALAQATGAARALSVAVRQAGEWLGTPIPPWVTARLAAMAGQDAGTPDPWSDPPGGPSLARMAARVRAAAGWRAKRDVVLARLAPPAGELGLTAEEAQRPAAIHRARLARLGRIARGMLKGGGR